MPGERGPQGARVDEAEAGELRVADLDDDPAAVVELAEVDGHERGGEAPRGGGGEGEHGGLVGRGELRPVAAEGPVVAVGERLAVQEEHAVFAADREFAGGDGEAAEREELSDDDAAAREVALAQELVGDEVGVVEALSGFYLPEGFKDIAAYVVVLVMLVVRPNGLFGGHARKKV